MVGPLRVLPRAVVVSGVAVAVAAILHRHLPRHSFDPTRAAPPCVGRLDCRLGAHGLGDEGTGARRGAGGHVHGRARRRAWASWPTAPSRRVFSGKVSSRAFLHQLYSMGVQSLPLVMRHRHPLRHRDLAAGRLPVHGLGPALRAGQRRDHERGPGAGAGADRDRGDRPRGRAHHRRARHHAGLGADRRALLAGPRPGARCWPRRASWPGMPAMAALVAIANFVGVFAGMVAAQATVGLGQRVASSTARGCSGTATTCSTRS